MFFRPPDLTYFARFLRDDGIDVATGDACRHYDTLFMGGILAFLMFLYCKKECYTVFNCELLAKF